MIAAVLIAVVVVCAADAMIIFENPDSAADNVNNTVSYTDPYRTR